jgi:hypothetical protein
MNKHIAFLLCTGILITGCSAEAPPVNVANDGASLIRDVAQTNSQPIEVVALRNSASKKTSPPITTPQQTSPSATTSGNCYIKGNINSKKQKLYHLQNCPSYKVTIIDTTAGERCFNSESAAIAAGWKKAGNCP